MDGYNGLINGWNLKQNTRTWCIPIQNSLAKKKTQIKQWITLHQGWVSNPFFKSNSIDGDEHLHGFCWFFGSWYHLKCSWGCLGSRSTSWKMKKKTQQWKEWNRHKNRRPIEPMKGMKQCRKPIEQVTINVK